MYRAKRLAAQLRRLAPAASVLVAGAAFAGSDARADAGESYLAQLAKASAARAAARASQPPATTATGAAVSAPPSNGSVWTPPEVTPAQLKAKGIAAGPAPVGRHDVAQVNVLALRYGPGLYQDDNEASGSDDTLLTPDFATAVGEIEAVMALPPAEALYIVRSARPLVAHPRTTADIANIEAEAALVLNVRGVPPAAAAAAEAAFTAAAAADTWGFTWYVLSDATPEGVAETLARHARFGARKVHSDTPLAPAAPVVALLDVVAATHSAYHLTPAAAASKEALGAVTRKFATRAGLTPEEGARAFAPLKPGRVPLSVGGHGSAVVDVTPATFEAVVMDPNADVLLEAYMENCPMCMSLGPRVKMAAEVLTKYLTPSSVPGRTRLFVVAGYNVDAYDRPREWLPGPAFPSIQMFNGGAGALSKGFGAGCPHQAALGVATPDQATSHLAPVVAGVAARTVAAGDATFRLPAAVTDGTATPSCVPALDFKHPTLPGKMALPTVKELVAWACVHSSQPFDPLAAGVQVPASALQSGGEAPPSDALIPLSTLLEDMEAEANGFTRAVFDLMFLEYVAGEYATMHGYRAPPAGVNPVNVTLAGLASRFGLPAPEPAEAAAAAQALTVAAPLLEAARAAVYKGGVYGGLPAALQAVDALDEVVRGGGMLDAVRGFRAAEKQAETEDEALALAKDLLA